MSEVTCTDACPGIDLVSKARKGQATGYGGIVSSLEVLHVQYETRLCEPASGENASHLYDLPRRAHSEMLFTKRVLHFPLCFNKEPGSVVLRRHALRKGNHLPERTWFVSSTGVPHLKENAGP